MYLVTAGPIHGCFDGLQMSEMLGSCMMNAKSSPSFYLTKCQPNVCPTFATSCDIALFTSAFLI